MEVSQEYYADWGTLAMINAAIAQSKDRSGMNWFLLSLVLEPLATLLLITVYRNPSADLPEEEFDLDDYQKQ